jgi:hypothetical protein
MSRVDGDRISFPSAHHIRNLPGLSAPPYIDDQSLVASTRRSVGTAVRDLLDDVDQGCLITNVHKHTDRRTHIVNAQWSDAREKADVVCLKNASKDVDLIII